MKKLTEKEKTLVKEYAKNGGNGTEAALKAYKTKSRKQASTIAAKELKKTTVQTPQDKELKKQGITLNAVISPIAKGLKAKKRGLDGRIILDENRQPIDDLDLQLKASDRALKLLLHKEKVDVNFNINIDYAKLGGEFVMEGETEDE